MFGGHVTIKFTKFFYFERANISHIQSGDTFTNLITLCRAGRGREASASVSAQ